MLFAQEAGTPATSPELGIAGLILLAVAAFAGLFALLLPALIAIGRGHRSWMAIAAVSLFFGWTVFGWLVALIWSLSDTGRRD